MHDLGGGAILDPRGVLKKRKGGWLIYLEGEAAIASLEIVRIGDGIRTVIGDSDC